MTEYLLSVLPSLDKRLRQAQRVLIATDFDGTLCSIANSPSEVRVAQCMFEILRNMSMSTRVKLAVISGRALDDVTRRLPIDVIFAGNHGLEIRGEGIQFEHEAAQQLRPQLKEIYADLAEIISAWPGAWIEDKGLSATVHYRAIETEQQDALRCAVRRCVVGRMPQVGLRSANMALEIYPKTGWGKGEAIQHIQEALGPFDMCLCLGDDLTDEDMFRDDPMQVNIKIGPPSRPTKAKYHLSDPSEVAILLEHVLSVCESMTIPECDPVTAAVAAQ